MKAPPDFFSVEAKHTLVHTRLLNWARWCRNSSGSGVTPMFRLYVPDEHWEGANASIPVNILDAADLQKGMKRLPEKHAKALSWCYVRAGNPIREARRLGVSQEGLADLTRSARQMLINLGFEKYALQRIEIGLTIAVTATAHTHRQPVHLEAAVPVAQRSEPSE